MFVQISVLWDPQKGFVQSEAELLAVNISILGMTRDTSEA